MESKSHASIRQLEFQLLAVLAGLATAAQSRVNGELSITLSNPTQAALISFSVGWLALIGISLFNSKLRTGLRRIRKAISEGRLQSWQIVGGTFGASFVAVQSFAVPLVGVALFTIAVIAAQTGNSLVVDRLGLGPARLGITRNRVVAAAVAVVGVLVAVANRISDTGFVLWAMFAAMAVGGLVAVQHAINGRVALAADSALAAAWLNFAFGVGALTAFNVVIWTFDNASFAPLPEQIWLYSGGLLGVLFIVIAAKTIGAIGSLKFTLAATTGQLFGAVLFDLLVPISDTEFNLNLVIGLGLTAAAVLLANQVKR